MYNYPPFPYSMPTCDSCGKEVSLNRKGQIQPHAGLYGVARCPAERLAGEPPGLSDGERFVWAMVEAHEEWKRNSEKSKISFMPDTHPFSDKKVDDNLLEIISQGVKITIY
jgi:hypothetical protein